MTRRSDTGLDAARFRADPLADRVIAAIVGPWTAPSPSANAQQAVEVNAARWQRLAAVNALFDQWTDNASLDGFDALGPGLSAGDDTALHDYVNQARKLPGWADRRRIQRAEGLFSTDGPMSCLLLFCASLPECYVVPDLAAVLHVSGQLERHADYRIRATAAMIFPLMLRGGLTEPHGAGVSQVLKVRLIHAMIRNLILHGDPEQAPALVAPVPAMAGTQHMHQALHAHGWNVARDGLPCNQEELAYTLLTFGYVYLRGMRRLGIGLSPGDEEAVLHAWNVMAHLLGVQRELMADDMKSAEALFARMQSRGRAEPVSPDPRPALATALMQVLEDAIPVRLFKPFPVLLARRLCGADNARDLGLEGRVGVPTRWLFAALMGTLRGIDAACRLVWHEFSLSRFVSRLIGYRLITGLLMDQTRPLKLPLHLRGEMMRTVDTWSDDARAPRWLNRLEDRWTTRGRWSEARQA